MNGDQADVIDAAKPADVREQRQRSTIGFPYVSLNDAIEMAEAIHNHVGLGACDDDQLSAWLGVSPKSSSFRVQVYASRTFGVIENNGSGGHRLTELGRAIVDPSQAREAKARAFLTVPLYRAIFDKYRGGVIPPAAALERDIVGLGVAEKQKDRARQVFERSAEQAGFFEHGRNRLVMPGVASHGHGHHVPPPIDKPPPPPGGGGGFGGGAASGGGGGSGHPDPLIAALIQKLPPPGADWPVDDRITWLQMISMAFQMTYGQKEGINITKQNY